MENTEFVVETHNLCKAYKKKMVVNNVNIHIQKGDIYGFVGENGAGKTTVIRLLTGLANPTHGTYSLLGINSKNKQIYTARRKTGAIVEAVSVNRSFTALENLKTQCTLIGIKKSDSQLIEVLKTVGLDYEEVKIKKVKNFSLGMRQRLGLASIMVSDPELVFLDEPMNGLDPKGIIEMREIILKLNRDYGVTFLISSHILSELDKICNRVGFLSHGKLLEEISMNDLKEKARRKITLSLDNRNSIDLVVKGLKLEKYDIENLDLQIFDDLNINDVMAYLVKNKIEITSIDVKNDTVEDYYIKLVVKGEVL